MRSLIALAVATAATLTGPAAADAFCGFYVAGADTKLYNNATQVVMMRKGTRTVLSMQNNYQGPPERFALVVPVPAVLQEANVKTLPHEVFDRVDSLAAPRLVEYWEQDPCFQPEYEDRMEGMRRPSAAPTAAKSGAGADLGVTVEAEFEVGEYEIVILSARDSSGLETWLKQEKYSIPDGAEPFLRPYVQGGSKFFVARVNPDKVTFKDGMATLSPLRFFYDSTEFALPVRLGLMNAQGKQDLIVHILAPNQRYEVANYPNVTIPTNLDVVDEARTRFGEFYAALFDRTVEKNPKAVVTEYSWDAGTCDPCPTPALNYGELLTLGLDVLDTPMPKPAPKAQAKPDKKKGPVSGKKGDAVDDLLAKPSVAPRRMPPRPRPPFQNFVLTRLHARYDASSMTEDLVFREAGPIAGGREVRNAQGGLENGSITAPRNNFQARYSIRHPWTGPIKCDNPVRGRWGGPPAGQAAEKPRPALDLAFAPRGKTQLASMVKQEIPEIGVKPAAGSSGDVPPAKEPAASDTEPKKKKEEKKGCSAAGGGGAWLLLLDLFALIAVRRRRA
jgi:hypothetical protein